MRGAQGSCYIWQVPELILASASPRRRDLLATAGFRFSVRARPLEEVRRAVESPVEYVRRLSYEKAMAARLRVDEIVLGADTVVVVDDNVLEKPRDLEDAVRMLTLLSGRRHQVITGICLRRGDRTISSAETTQVEFSPLTAAEIDAYVATGEPMDKAGAYAIQGIASRWITRIDGCYFNVVGLPVARVWRELLHLTGNEHP